MGRIKIKIGIISLIILATLIRLLILLNSDNFAGNVTMGRVTGALCILKNPSLRSNFDGNTSVLYEYLLAAALRLWYDPLLTPRVLSLVFGILLVIPFYYLVKILFKEKIAVYSCILLCLYPLHAIYSTLSLSDVISHFFFFSSLYYLFKFKQNRKISALLLSVALFNIVSMLRFDSWIFIPLLAAFIYKGGKKYSIIFFFSSLALPLIWLYLCKYYTGNAFYSFTTTLKTAQAEIILRAPHSKQFFAWFFILYKVLGPAVVVSGIAGIVYSLFNRSFLHLAILFLVQYSFYTINTLMSRMWLVERYTILLGLFLLPYAVLSLERLSSSVKLKSVALLLPFVFLSVFEFKRIVISHIPKIPAVIEEVSNWLKNNTSPSDRLILSADSWDLSDQDIIVRSGVFPRDVFLTSTPLASLDPDLTTRIKGYITTEKPVYLILNSTSYLQSIINFDMNQKKQNEFGHTLELVYSLASVESTVGNFNIYKIVYDIDRP